MGFSGHNKAKERSALWIVGVATSGALVAVSVALLRASGAERPARSAL